MAFLDQNVRSATGTRHPALFRDIAAFWRHFILAAFDPYRPEQHYMRGPGPAWHAKHGGKQNRDEAARSVRAE